MVASEARVDIVQTISERFNPLHCGAVVASELAEARVDIVQVSIPFIAGQWSLRERRSRGSRTPGRFQSPSLRGSGRFPQLGMGFQGVHVQVSIPFIAGQWSLPGRPGT